MASLLIRNAEVVVTMDDERREIAGGGLFCRDGWIEHVGPTATLPTTADDVFDATGHVVLPGLVDTHHHLYQTLTRAVPGTQDVSLFAWLTTLYPIWARMTPDDVAVSTLVGLGELARSGCTTTSDHLYLFPNGSTLDDSIHAAALTGMRFHAARGSMSLGESAGGLPPDHLVENEADIIADTQRLIETFHDPDPGAMIRIVVAPCSPFSVTPAAMIESARLARAYGVTMHTHLAETADEDRFCEERFGVDPIGYAERVGWLGDDVWFAHGVHVDAAGVATLAASGTGIAHCPTSNMRLASGIAPLREYLDAGVRVGLGVDGSASNDGSNLLGEARQALLAARVRTAIEGGGSLLSARRVLEIATRGGAAVLGRDDIGTLAPGKAADIVAVDVRDVDHAGAADPVAALVLCWPGGVSRSWVHGRPLVVDGHVATFDLPEAVERHRAASQRIVTGS